MSKVLTRKYLHLYPRVGYELEYKNKIVAKAQSVEILDNDGERTPR